MCGDIGGGAGNILSILIVYALLAVCLFGGML
jgi:hypothetical protein